MFKPRAVIIVVGLIVLGATQAAVRADTTVTLNAVDSGWYKATGQHDATNDNYLVGHVSTAGELRNYFVFDLSSVRGSIRSATLRVLNPPLGYESVDPSETYTTFDVTTTIADLMSTNDTRSDIHDDLGSGTTYGSTEVFDPSDNVVIAVSLNGSALGNLNLSRGLFAIGGAVTSLRGQESEYLFGGSDGSGVRQLVLTVAPPFMIDEFRLAGPLGSADEFVEFYNNDIAPLTVDSTDGSAGWALVSSDGVTRFVIPNGTTIPVRGHFLVTNNSVNGYSLSDYGGVGASVGDGTYTGDIPTDSGLALFQTASPANFSLANRIDAVGFNTVPDALYREGSGLGPTSGVTPGAQFSLARSLASGTPLDTDNNAQNFILLGTGGAMQGTLLGAPGPENLSSPIQRNATIKASYIDPNCAGNGTPSTACARVRDFTVVPNGSSGTLSIRRRFRNNTGVPVLRLRFRVVDMTTGGALVGTADLRLLTSSDIPAATLSGGGTVFIRGLTLEEPPAQPNGGGLNATVSDQTITLISPLAPGASVNVQFLLGVQQAGSFRLFFNVEGLPAPTSPIPQKRRGVKEL